MDPNFFQAVSDISKPATLLLEKISNAIGRRFDPRQVARMAEAEGQAHQIRERFKAETVIEVADLYRRAERRAILEEAQTQYNLESVINLAFPRLEDSASPDDIEDDWVTNLLGKCRTVSDEDMQELWARILAGEANKPGTVSRRTVNLAADLDKREAGSFMELCSFVWEINGDAVPVILDWNDDVYRQSDFDLLRLRECGLVTIGSGAFALRFGPLPKTVIVSYSGQPLEITLPLDENNFINVGEIRFTTAGSELLKVCEPEPAKGFFDYMYNCWATLGYLS